MSVLEAVAEAGATRARGWAAPVLAAVSGALPLLVFPAPGWWWFGYVCLVPLMLVLRTAASARRALLLGWLGGIGFLVGVMSWLIPTLSVAIVVLAALLGLLWAPLGWLVWRLLHGTPDGGRSAAALVLVPSGWLLIETVRSWQYLGGPWGLLGASQYAQHFALRLASVGGVWADSLLLVAVNTALVVLVAAWGRCAVAWGALLAMAGCVGAVLLWAPGPRATGRGVSVGVVQPGVIATPEARVAREELLTRQLLAAHPDIVLWGESSLSYDLTARRRLAGQLAALSRQAGADLMVGVDAERPGSGGGIYKSSVVVGPDGPTGQVYDKIRLVPFGEYIPLRPALGWIADLSKAAGVDRRRGTAQVVMTLPTRGAGPLRVGPLICFESAFPDMSRALAERGAQLLLVQSSTSSYQDTWAPAQHASLAALRAAETGRPVVQATLTGVSTAYDATGRRVGVPLGTDRSDTAVYTVPLASGRTLYDRWGNWLPVAAAALVLLWGLGWAGVNLRNRRQ